MSTISYGFHRTPFGECLIAFSDQGVCHLSFVDGNPEEALKILQKEWPKTQLQENTAATQKLIQSLFEKTNPKESHIQIHLKGTPFQVAVWDVLLTIKRGTTVSYQDIAYALEQPTAVRAVASAIANNRIAFIVPCHRVIAKSGKIHKYRWGTERKKALLDWEAD